MRSSPSDRGAEMVEFAFVLPILLALVMGIIEFGFALFAQASIAGGAREAARVQAIYTSTMSAPAAKAAAVQAAKAAAAPAVTLADGEIAVTANCDAAPPNDVVTVTISHPYAGLTGWLPAVTLDGTGVMRCNG